MSTTPDHSLLSHCNFCPFSYLRPLIEPPVFNFLFYQTSTLKNFLFHFRKCFFQWILVFSVFHLKFYQLRFQLFNLCSLCNFDSAAVTHCVVGLKGQTQIYFMLHHLKFHFANCFYEGTCFSQQVFQTFLIKFLVQSFQITFRSTFSPVCRFYATSGCAPLSIFCYLPTFLSLS